MGGDTRTDGWSGEGGEEILGPMDGLVMEGGGDTRTDGWSGDGGGRY